MHPGLSLGPRSIERPADAGYTLVGTLDGRAPHRVDGAGLVEVAPRGLSVDWHVRADDRWHHPAREPTVRQRRLGAGAVLETAVRIPSGDAVQRVYSVNGSDGDLTIVEIENQSPVPVAVALTVRPYDCAGHVRPVSLDISDERIAADGTPTVLLPRRPNEHQVSVERDVIDDLEAGRSLDGTDVGSGDAASAAVVFPVPHSTSLRFVIPVEDGPDRVGPLPDADAVARGWTSVIEAGGRFLFPDPGVTEQANAARARLLSEVADLPGRVADLDAGAGRILEALALSGAVGEIMGSLGVIAGSFPTEISGAARPTPDTMADASRASAGRRGSSTIPPLPRHSWSRWRSSRSSPRGDATRWRRTSRCSACVDS